MVLEIPGKLFGQEDVRETPTTEAATGTKYWSCLGVQFQIGIPKFDDASYKPTGGDVQADQVGVFFYAPVSLPQGAVVTGVIVYGDAAAGAENWTMVRVTLTDITAATMATANINTEDSTISNDTIDNQTYGYFIKTSTLDTNDNIFGARVTYTI